MSIIHFVILCTHGSLVSRIFKKSMQYELTLKWRFCKIRDRCICRDLGIDWWHVDARIPHRPRFSLFIDDAIHTPIMIFPDNCHNDDYHRRYRGFCTLFARRPIFIEFLSRHGLACFLIREKLIVGSTAYNRTVKSGSVTSITSSDNIGSTCAAKIPS